MTSLIKGKNVGQNSFLFLMFLQETFVVSFQSNYTTSILFHHKYSMHIISVRCHVSHRVSPMSRYLPQAAVRSTAVCGDCYSFAQSYVGGPAFFFLSLTIITNCPNLISTNFALNVFAVIDMVRKKTINRNQTEITVTDAIYI